MSKTEFAPSLVTADPGRDVCLEGDVESDCTERSHDAAGASVRSSSRTSRYPTPIATNTYVLSHRRQQVIPLICMRIPNFCMRVLESVRKDTLAISRNSGFEYVIP